MSDDNEFEPKLGRIGNRQAKRAQRYLSRLVTAISRAGGIAKSRRGNFSGSRIGRGGGAGAVLHDCHQGFRARRVIVKSHIAKLGEKGFKMAQTYLRYIQRDGVTRDGQPGELYTAGADRTEDKDFLEGCKDDRHQFRFIVAPEDGEQYEHLRDVTRRLMRQMERDLNTKLDWVAVDHFDTGHPHTHVVVRGKDDRGKDLIIARDYMTHGMRARAAEIVTLDLGERSNLEIEHKLRQEMEQERFTSLDRSLLQDADGEGRVSASLPQRDAYSRLRQTLRAGRLQTLKRLGLAEQVKPGQWQLSPDLEPTLRRMGERGDIIKTLHKAMSREKIERAAIDQAIYDPIQAKPITGRLIERGLSDEVNDRHYLIVDGVDGRTHYVEIGKGEATDLIPKGAIIGIKPRSTEPRRVDHTVAEIAATNNGRYDVDIHLRHEPNCSYEFAQTHV
jgi:type IV secretory pathway VirD2 relaxase